MTRMVLFNGAVLIRAGGATKIDPSAFQNLGAGGVGVVGIVGEADAGEPNAVHYFRDGSAMVNTFRAGPLADAADLLFAPMNDFRVPGGAVQVLAVAANQLVQSGLSLYDGSTIEQMTLLSIAYGIHTNKITVAITTSGTGKIVEFTYKDGETDITETSSVLGSAAEMTLTYTGDGTTATVTVTPTQLTTALAGDQTDGSLDLSISFADYENLQEVIDYINEQTGYTAAAVTTNPYGIGGANLDRITGTNIKSTVADLKAQLYRMIEWINANSSLINATRTTPASSATSGTTTGSNAETFNMEPADTLLIAPNGGGPQTSTWDAAAAEASGSAGVFATMAAETMSVQFDAFDAQTVTFGTEGTLQLAINAINAQLTGGYAEATGGTTPVKLISDTKGTDSRVRTASVAAGITTKLGIQNTQDESGTGDVANIDAVTAQEVIDVINNDTTLLVASIESLKIKLTSDLTGSAASIQVTAGNARTILGFDTNVHVGADSGAGGEHVPADSAAAFLTGGSRGASTNSNWQAAFDLLGQVRANQVVPLISEDLANQGLGSTATFASVAAAADAHAAYYSSTKGKSERENFLGMKATKANLIAQAGTLQSPHTVLTGQRITRRDAASELSEFDEWGLACLMAGGRAGSLLSEPLVYKNIRCSGLTQDAGWNPDDDIEDLILAGVTVAFAPPNRGFKFDRVITTYTKLDNDALVEESIVQGWKVIAYESRTQLEDIYTGTRGLPATVQNIKDSWEAILEAYRKQGAIVDSVDESGVRLLAYRDVKVTLDGDKAYMRATISPVPGINFLLQTLFLVPATISA